MPTNSLKNALIKLFSDNKGKIFSVQDIYNQFHNYYDLSEYQLEDDVKYPQARFKHEIRSILAKLVREQLVAKPERNQYVKNK